MNETEESRVEISEDYVMVLERKTAETVIAEIDRSLLRGDTVSYVLQEDSHRSESFIAAYDKWGRRQYSCHLEKSRTARHTDFFEGNEEESADGSQAGREGRTEAYRRYFNIICAGLSLLSGFLIIISVYFSLTGG